MVDPIRGTLTSHFAIMLLRLDPTWDVCVFVVLLFGPLQWGFLSFVSSL